MTTVVTDLLPLLHSTCRLSYSGPKSQGVKQVDEKPAAKEGTWGGEMNAENSMFKRSRSLDFDLWFGTVDRRSLNTVFIMVSVLRGPS